MSQSEIRSTARRFLKDERGATAIEYAMMLVIFSMVVTGALSYLGSDLSDMFERLDAKLKG